MRSVLWWVVLHVFVLLLLFYFIIFLEGGVWVLALFYFFHYGEILNICFVWHLAVQSAAYFCLLSGFWCRISKRKDACGILQNFSTFLMPNSRFFFKCRRLTERAREENVTYCVSTLQKKRRLKSVSEAVTNTPITFPYSSALPEIIFREWQNGLCTRDAGWRMNLISLE